MRIVLEALHQSWDFILELIRLLRFADLLDIALVTIIIYRVLSLIRGTRTLQILTGLGVLSLIYWASTRFEVRTVKAILGYLFDNLFIVIVLIFQQEIRRGLSRVGWSSFFASIGGFKEEEVVEEVIKAAISLANKKIGALMVIENQADVLDFVEAGTLVDSTLDREILTSIFMPVSPLHDGAVILRKGRIHMAGCFLPLTLNPNVSKAIGTRHRAAVGLTEETDAVCLVISEENGGVSIAREGKLIHNLDASQLRKILMEALTR